MEDNLIELHHFGEVLVEIIIKALGPKKFREFLIESSFYPGQGKKGTAELPFSFDDFEVASFVKIESDEGLEFDSESDIDVGIFFTHLGEPHCFPIEVKMGTKGPVSSWTSFTHYMVNKKPVSLQENGRVLNGCMPSLLSGTPKAGKHFKLKATIKERHLNAKFNFWGLCIRTKVDSYLEEATKKEIKDRISEIGVLPLIFHFDDLKKFAVGKNVPVEKLVRVKLNSAVDNVLCELFHKITL